MITQRGTKFRDTVLTERLLLRRPDWSDSQAIFDRYASDPQVTQFLTWQPHASPLETKDHLACLFQDFKAGTRMPWAIETRSDDRLIGMIELRLDGSRAEVGYVLARDAWGQGYATEALGAVVDEALAVPSISRVWAVCNINHTASARVLAKAGMSREALLRRYSSHPNHSEGPSDVFLYKIEK